ncbi:nitroreductase family protein [Novacetimonas pomaceti]|uniref:NADPH-dependent oxidoreductase n=1 Tax=Novacetimonas pomaceti TaxID=2021998 RepID=A0A318QBU3_9PROT|nr:nitroreductase family protein [Novacetimonas pomaceti]PYD76405.1 NADPH-dependent oxidoreductase [Novacetimonas pomaceti]
MTDAPTSSSSLADLWKARYRQPPPDGALPENVVVRSLMAHRSVRSFSTAPVPQGVLESAIAAAQSASSSCNFQAWSVVAVTDPQRRARLARLAGDQAFIAQAPLFLVWVADLSRLEHVAEAQAQPHVALDYLESFVMAVADTSFAAQNAAAAFESFGLGIVYVGAVRNHPSEIASELGLPPRTVAVFGMCVGHPDRRHPTAIKPRLPQSVVLHHEKYAGGEEEIPAYDACMTRFRTDQGLSAQDWSTSVIGRVRDAAALHGRDRLRMELVRRGFELR